MAPWKSNEIQILSYLRGDTHVTFGKYMLI